MTAIRTERLKAIRQRVEKAEISASSAIGVRRWWYRALAWGHRLHHEFVLDEVSIRAESLSYFTLFSALPVLAGLTLALGWVSVWGPAEERFHSLLEQFLEPIPSAHRQELLAFITQFKDEYLASIQERTTTLGSAAFLVLLWIALQVFLNVENLLNHIWDAPAHRAWWERARNFILSGLVVPIFGALAVAVPSLVSAWFGVSFGFGVQEILPTFVFCLGTFFAYRMFPNTRVSAKSAWLGAGFASTLFLITSSLLHFYFSWGTQTAYGKAASLPLVAFFIFVFWVIFILGAEVSFLHQSGRSRKP